MPDSWLFAKDGASVRILRTGPLTLEVYGPGDARDLYSFAEATHAVRFLRDIENELAASGFRLKGYAADRRTGRERRERIRVGERRRTTPG